MCAGAGSSITTAKTESFLNPEIPKETKVSTWQSTGLTIAGTIFIIFLFLK